MVLQVMESATQATHTLAHRRMHTHSLAKSMPVLHMNDITVKFSGEVFGGWGGQRGTWWRAAL